jgi:serine/threonine protein kinase
VSEDHDNTVVQRVDPLIGGVVVNRFRIREKIAAGGFGAIYRAEHMASAHEVAIKVLHPQLAADPNVIARFRREGSTLSKLRAPHTVTTYEFGEAPDGMLYIVMELLRGVSLHERLRERGMLPWREALQIARAICISLAEAHALGIVHRDLKPANIHLEARGDTDYVKVLDFGIAKIKRGSSTDEGPELTNAGQMIGTIDYMAPEQILGAQPDHRSDIFTLGILLFEMISGRRPFSESATPTSMLAALLTQIAPKLSTYAPVPHSLDTIVAKCLSRELHDRFANVTEISEQIDRVLMSSSDDGATRTIAIGIHTQKWEEEEATLMADAHPDNSYSTIAPHVVSRPRANTLESVAPPVPPRPQHTPRPVQVTPAPQTIAPHAAQRVRPPTPAPPMPTPNPPVRQHPPTPFPPYPFVQQQQHQPPPWTQPVINPSAQMPVDNSGWQVPQQGRPYAPPVDPGRQSQPYIPPAMPSYTPGGMHVDNRGSGPIAHGQLKSYDPNRDAAVGRIIWIVAILIVVGLAIAIYQFVR